MFGDKFEVLLGVGGAGRDDEPGAVGLNAKHGGVVFGFADEGGVGGIGNFSGVFKAAFVKGTEVITLRAGLEAKVNVTLLIILSREHEYALPAFVGVGVDLVARGEF